MNTQEISTISILKNLDKHELEHLCIMLKEKLYKKGSTIVAQDQLDRSLMFILDGSVKVNLISRDGKEIIITNLNNGDFFGEISLLTKTPRTANVIAQSNCRIAILTAEDFDTHTGNFTGLSKAMLIELANRLRLSSKKIADLALFDVYRRLARTLRSLAHSVNVESQEKLIINNRPTHQELAALTGTSREMITRALKGLEEDGCIKISGKQIEFVKMPL